MPAITIDEKQMQQVFLNIVINALQAMPDGGDLEIKVHYFHRIVYVNVSDTGMGIPKSMIDNIFKPFFTTRAQGPGLGLSITKRILEEHEGDISAESEEGTGTTITVALPIDEVY